MNLHNYKQPRELDDIPDDEREDRDEVKKQLAAKALADMGHGDLPLFGGGK